MKIYFNHYVFILPSDLNTFFINSLGNSRNLWHYQWPAEFIKQKKPASKWHQIALYERWMWVFWGFFFFLFFFFGGGGVNNRIILQSMVLLLIHCKRKWSSYLNVKNRYLGMTGVTKKLHKSIAKFNYELNNSKKMWGVVKSPILMIMVAAIIIARISKDFHKSWTKNNIILKLFGFCRVFSLRLVPRQLGDETAVWCMCGDQVPVNLQTARKCTGITRIYMLHINPDTA